MDKLLNVDEATQLILDQRIDFGIETISIDAALGLILAENLYADRDFPPFDRVTMDGIAINFELFKNSQGAFKIEGMQFAGEAQKALDNISNCLEVMTGASLPINTDTVIRYEDVTIENGFATIQVDINAKQNVHRQGEDHRNGDLLVKKNTRLRSAELAVAATVGKTELLVKKLPKIAVVTSGDELVNVDKKPLPHQIRHSNNYSIAGLLQPYGITVKHFHVADDLEETTEKLASVLAEFDVLIISGGVSMGKKDFIPDALAALGVEKLFHKIAQRPGKPFWFGRKNNKLVFALPGNPVSSFVCVRRYVIPWLRQSMGLKATDFMWARLSESVSFKPDLTYFLQVKLEQDKKAVQWATPIQGNGSGDFVNLTAADAFIELPSEAIRFQKGEVFRAWKF